MAKKNTDNQNEPGHTKNARENGQYVVFRLPLQNKHSFQITQIFIQSVFLYVCVPLLCRLPSFFHFIRYAFPVSKS